ncbi:MAG TPA: DUF5681 domain-containing protein [Bradyrhizobium sp.]|nr:DUF5681 domain-containing protein [Bradyrhizobium sp.]
MSNNEKVGYCNPPKSTRFQKGKSGNPNGRRKKPGYAHRSARGHLKDDIVRVLKRPVKVTEAGKTKSITAQRALIKSLVNNAINGDSASIAHIWTMFKHFGLDREPQRDLEYSRWTPALEAMLEQFLNEENISCAKAAGPDQSGNSSLDRKQGVRRTADDPGKQYLPERVHMMDDLLLELQEMITVTEDGKTKTIAKQEALLHVLLKQAMMRKRNAFNLLWAMLKRYELDQEPDKYLVSSPRPSSRQIEQFKRDTLRYLQEEEESAGVEDGEDEVPPGLLPG